MYFRILFSFLFLTAIHPSLAQEILHDHSIQHAFIENKGQWEEPILFKAKFSGGNLWVQQKKMVFHLQDFSATHEAHANFTRKIEHTENRQTVVHLNFVGANDVTEIEKSHATTSYYNYFIGNDKSKWASDVHGFGEAVMKNLYNGIDLKLIEQQDKLKYEFHVQPSIDPNLIQLDFAGQDKLSIDKKGNLVVSTILGNIIEQKPYAYQIVNGNIREVTCDFVLLKNRVNFKLGDYNPNAILIIDPVLVFATYAGSLSDNFGMTATYGYDETAYSGGTVFGNNYPMPDGDAYDITSNFTVTVNPTYGITDVFISKYSPDGTAMIWSTYLGGGDGNQGTEAAHSMICDEFNNVYVYGTTSSTDFPIQGGYQSVHAGGVLGAQFYFNGVYFDSAGTDIYVAKISANGQNLLASTYFGGSGNDGINYRNTVVYDNVAAYDSITPNYGDQFRGEIMIDSLGNCLVASCTRSTDFPTLNAFQATNAGLQDGVIFKLNSDLSALQWSSYYGGSNNDACYSVKLDSDYNVVFSGGTCSNDLTNTGGGWQPAYGGGKTDGFVMKLSPDGSTISNGTYLGMTNTDQAYFVEIDRVDDIYVLGQSAGGLFPVINSPFVNPGSSQFVIKFEPTLTVPQNSTVFGNGGSAINISPSAFLVDICGNIYISGWGANILQGTPLSGMPVTSDAFQGTPPNGFDFYLLVIERNFADTLYGSYLGGINSQEHVDGGTSRFDKNGVVYQSVCAGCRLCLTCPANSDFPTTPGAWSNNNLSHNCNNVVFKFDFELIPNAEFIADNTEGCAPFTVNFDNLSSDSDSYLWDFGNGETLESSDSIVTVVFDTAGVYVVYLYVTDSVCLITDTAFMEITVYDNFTLAVSADTIICQPVPITMNAYTSGYATEYIWSTNINFTDTLNSNLSDSVFTTTPTEPTTYYVQATYLVCSHIDSITVNFEYELLNLTGDNTICNDESTIITAVNSSSTITFSYVWTPDSILVNPSVSNSVEVDPDVSQYLFLEAMSSTGCLVYDSIQILVGYVPSGSVIATSSAYNIAEGDEVTLYGEPSGYSYLWEPSNLVDNPTAQQTTATVESTTLFTFYVSDGICTKSETVLIKTFAFICGEPFIYIPNAFSPNGDGENDILYVRGQLIEGMLFRIFDRWGEMVFESTDRNYGWDGTFRGKALDPDVYDYYLKAICIDGEESIIKGNITLLK